MSTTTEVLALGITVLVHFLGALVLVGYIARSSGADLWGWWPGGDDDDGPDPGPAPHAPSPTTDGIPLADARQAAVRLRDADRLAEGYPRPVRRPAHPEPARTPQREREPA